MRMLLYKAYDNDNRCMAEARAEWERQQNREQAGAWLGRALRYVWEALGYE